MTRTLALLVTLTVAVIAPRAARGDDLTVGLYAPSAPFAGTAARLDYVSRLAGHLAADAGATPAARVYVRAGDFAAAVKKGELDLAVVDATYLASIHAPYTVLATATRGGDPGASWQLVTRGGERAILALEGKIVLCPSVGGREADFVHNALLGGELPPGFFGAIDSSPDLASVLAALGLGRADAAVVPVGVDLPAGVSRVTILPAVSWPVLVAFPGAGDDLRRRAATAVLDFDGGDVLGGFAAGGGEAVRGLARRLGKLERRGPMVLLNLRVTVDELVEPRRPAILRVEVTTLLAAPPPLPAPGAP